MTKAPPLDRDLFPEETVLRPDFAIELKMKLPWCVSHVAKFRANLKVLSQPLKDAIKHHQKLAEAIADSLKLKSTIPLEQAFGPAWEREVDGLRALYTDYDEAVRDLDQVLRIKKEVV